MKINCCIVGTRYANGFECLDENAEVKLVLEPENAYSRYAIRVETEGGLKIGMVGENYIPKPLKVHRYNLSSSKTICQFLEQGYRIVKTVVDFIVADTAVLEVEMEFTGVVSEETTSEEVIEEMEELNMNVGQITVVGVSHHSGKAEEGDLVSFKVVKGTTTLMAISGESIGVLPQSDKKVKELEEAGLPIIKNRDKREDTHFLSLPYIVTDVIENKYVVVRELNEEDLINASNTDPEGSVLNETTSEEVVKTETVDEVVVEATTETEPVKVKAGEDKMKTRIETTKALISAKEEELNQLKSDLEMYEQALADIEHRNALISNIKEYIFGLATEDIEKIHNIVMSDVASSSDEEEDTSSSIEEETLEIKFNDHYDERISRFEQSDIQKEDNTCNIVLYYSNGVSFGSERVIKDVKLSNNNVEYIKSIIPHNQEKGEKVIELEMALETIL